MAHGDCAGLPSFSKLRLFSASWSAFLWYSVNRCCSMILSFSSKDTLASVFFLMFACEMEQGKRHLLFHLCYCKIVNCLLKSNANKVKKQSWNFTSSSSSFMIFSSLVCDALGGTQIVNLALLCPKFFWGRVVF